MATSGVMDSTAGTSTPTVQLIIVRRSREELKCNEMNIPRLNVDIRWHLPLSQELMSIDDLLQSVDAQIHTLFEGIFAEEKVQDADRVGIRIGFESDPDPFYTMAKKSHNPIERLFDGVARLLQSSRNLLLSNWSIQVTIFRASPGGTGDGDGAAECELREENIPGEDRSPSHPPTSRRGKGTRPWSASAIRNKRSLVTIKNTDELCLYRSLVVLLAFGEYQRMRDSPLPRTHRQALAVYRRVRDNRRDGQTLAARRLQVAASAKAPADEDDIVCVAHHLKRNITVVNAMLPSGIQFATRDIHDYGVDKTLYVWQNGAHFHPITNIRAFWGVSYYCKRCDTRSDHKYQHRCADDTSCRMCRRDPAEHTSPLAEPETCERCFRTFTDEKCLTLHETVICKRSWMCPRCERTYPHKRTPGDHVCYELKCSHCRVWVTNDHQCCIQPEKCKPHIAKLRFFDFESDLSSGTHIPNYAAASSDGKAFAEYFHPDGSSIIDQFLDSEILHADHQGTTFLAHYGRAYDTQFIQEALLKRGVQFEVIPNGHKLMQLSIPARKVRILDSHNFIPQPLANFPKLFALGQNVTKGIFPYRFNTRANFNYKGPMPPLEFFLPEGVDPNLLEHEVGPDLRDDDEAKLLAQLIERKRWYDDLVADGHQWYQLARLREYGVNDVLLGVQGCLRFQQDFIEVSRSDKWSDDGSSLGVDPFAYVTIASACMAAYKHVFLSSELLAYHKHSVDVHSHISILWLEYVAHTEDITITHARNSHGEARTAGFKVDGFCLGTKTVYEFNGCFFHGCRSCFPKKTVQYERQKQKEAAIKAAGYTVVRMWECAFRDFQHTPAYKEFARACPQLTEKLPLNVREAFFGGRTNAIRLYYKCAPDEMIHYSDFTSLYPWVNARCEYPVGHPEILLHPSLEKLERGDYFGVAKCRVLPPQDLYHPVLPVRVAEKLMFPLCRLCAETECGECVHSEEERALTGTWCTPELDQAVKEGYRILCVFEVHHFQKRVTGLFSEYVKTFLKGKQEASGWPKPDMSDEEKEAYITEYREHEGIQLEREKIEKNPGKRQVAKLMVTSFWGKTAQRGNLPLVSICLSSRALRAILFNDRYDVLSCDPYPAHVSAWRVVYREASHYLAVEPKNTNVYIAAFTTSHARLRLYGELKTLGERVLYCDTDSIIYTQKPGEASLPLGNFLGDLTDELGDGKHITEFVSTGPKSYSYKDNKECSTIKFKGISKTLFNVQRVNFESMLQCVQDATFMIHRNEGPKNMIFKTDKFGSVRTVYQYKVFRMVYRKRMIGDNYATYPFGYRLE